MFDVLKYLEPRREEANTVCINQDDEVLDILFFDKGVYAIGFEYLKMCKK
jgi:hypothetical protein